MIVRESTYREACRDRDIAAMTAHAYKLKYNQLLEEWNELVTKINDKGGEAFMNGSKQSVPLSGDDIRKLLMLIHPDKHGGKPMAQEMTAKILQIRDSK